MKHLIKPDKLKPGDKVAAISLSWGGPGVFPYRYEIGKKRLEEIFGLKVVSTKHALKESDWLYAHPEARAEDLMEAFSDPEIKAIISTIGGDDSIRLLPYVDFNIIRHNPKIFMGYSDTTVAHFMCLKAGLSSIYGPAVMTAFAENVAMHDYTIQGLQKMLFSGDSRGPIPQNTEGWTKEMLDWSDEHNQSIKRVLNHPIEWHFMGNVKSSSKGRLIGGCLEVLQFMIGTDLWPPLSIWDKAIFFLETSEEGIEPIILKRFLRNFAALGILESLSGILFSKPGGHQISLDKFSNYDEVFSTVFREYNIPLIPIVTRMDFGHSDPMWPLPYGALTEINPIQKTVTILES